MPKFKIGDTVQKANDNSRGVIVGIMPARRGRQLYQVNWNNHTSDELEADLLPVFDSSDPYERCASGIFDSYAEYSKKNTTFKIKSSNNSTISSLKASKTLFRAYQFKPLLKFLNSPSRRLLVADEVGLGKTIEAGHIMLELKARKQFSDVLIVCPMSLQEKWKAELIEKFALPFKIYDSSKDLIDDLENGHGNIHAIINYEKIRLKKTKDPDTSTGKKKKQYSNIIDYLMVNGHRFSLVLCDEAHKLRNSNTQTYHGAEIIMSCADSAVFLTATPIMISTENLYNLLHLLDNERYFNYQIFDNRLQENKPFVEAISKLNNNKINLPSVASDLSESEIRTSFSTTDNIEIYSSLSTVGEVYRDDPVYQYLLELFNKKDTPNNRAEIQYYLNMMSVMNNIFSRTRKREVTTDMSQAERNPILRKIDLSPNERAEFDSVIKQYADDHSYTDWWGDDKLTRGGALGLVQKKRQVASSVWGYLNSEKDLDNGIDAFADEDDAKFDELLEIIRTVFSSGVKKLVVFALFRKTLKYLKIRLKSKGIGSLIIHGEIDNRDEVLNEFKNNSKAQILLSSEVGSEGLDMQFCNSMVNYDLPWNPMVIEQRIGRIDRFGQKAKKVNIFNLVVSNSIQETIYLRLLDRIGIFKGTIGDMEAILDAPFPSNKSLTIQDVYNNLEKEFFTTELTPEEQEQKIEEIERAIANEQEDIKHLEEGLTNTLTNDAYFTNEIKRIKNNNSYVTEEELKTYLETVMAKALPLCDLKQVNKNVFDIEIPINAVRSIENFLTQYHPSGYDYEGAYREFKGKIDGKQDIMVTFSQDKAYDDRSLEFLNMYNILIQSCLRYNLQDDDKTKTSFCFALNHDNVLRKGSVYYLATYQVNVHRMVQGIEKTYETLIPLLYDVHNDRQETDQDLVDHVYSCSQVAGIEHNPQNSDIDKEMLQDIRYDFAETLSERKKEKIAELKREADSERIHNENQTKEYYRSRIVNLEKSIEEWKDNIIWSFNDDKERRRWENAIRLGNANINRLKKEEQERLDIIQTDPKISVDDEILSLNLIYVI